MRSRKNIFKEAIVLLVIVVMFLSTATVTANTDQTKKSNNIITEPFLKKSMVENRDVIFQDDFESYDDFILDFPPWTQFDGDGATTYGMANYDYPNEYYTGSFIIFNPSMTTPPCTDAPPHSGDKFVACFNAVLPASNNDWLITPQLNGNPFEQVSFWARAYTDAYQLDRFQVGISTTDTNPDSFTIISTPPYITATIEWTEYVYDLSDYNGNIYIAIHCVSNDAFILMIDDFTVSAQLQPPIPDLDCDGALSWDEVTPGATVTGNFQVGNIGEAGSLLNWEVESYPTDWGTWTFTPNSGTGVADGTWVTVDVSVVAPDEKNKEFTGKVKLVNSDDPADFCEIDIVLKTPREKTLYYPLIKILERFPIVFSILKFVRGF